MRDATLAQGALVLPQPVEDVILVHDPSYHKMATKAASLARGLRTKTPASLPGFCIVELVERDPGSAVHRCALHRVRDDFVA
jgi:hypothetical protein